jgi:hypothetical protein
MVTNCAIYLAISLPMSFISLSISGRVTHVLLCFIVCPWFVALWMIVLFLIFQNFMYLIQDSFGSSIYPKTSCGLNCTSKVFSCNFLDLTVRQSPQGLSCDIFDKRSQPEYAGIEMIRMPHVHSNISMTA